MEDIFVGREAEQQLLENLYAKQSSELVSITGRRRVGKTHLVNTVFKDRMDFYLTGIQNYNTSEHLKSFGYKFRSYRSFNILP